MFGPSVADALLALAQPPQGPRAAFLDDEDLARFTEARAALDALRAAIARVMAEGGSAWVDTAHLDGDSRGLIASMLADGEVSIRVTGPLAADIQETALRGVWMVEGAGKSGLEVGDIPACVRETVALARPSFAIPAPEDLPEGVMNILPILAEIRDAMATAAEGGADHEINLTLLPVTPTDHAVLHQAMGLGQVDILSRGYGNCRVVACAARHVWRSQFFNSEDKLILDLLQVGDVPVAAKATPEDMDESLQRLDDLLSAYFPG